VGVNTWAILLVQTDPNWRSKRVVGLASSLSLVSPLVKDIDYPLLIEDTEARIGIR